MAVIKIFDAKGVKTLILAGNAMEQDYDTVSEENIEASEDSEASE